MPKNGHSIPLALSGISKMKKYYWGCSKLLFMLLTLFGGFSVGFFLYSCRIDLCSLVIPNCPSLFYRLLQLLVVFLYLCYSLLLWKCWYLYFTKLHSLESYGILILQFLAASTPRPPLGIIHRTIKRSTDCSNVQVIYENTNCTGPRTDSRGTLLNIFLQFDCQLICKTFFSRAVCTYCKVISGKQYSLSLWQTCLLPCRTG